MSIITAFFKGTCCLGETGPSPSRCRDLLGFTLIRLPPLPLLSLPSLIWEPRLPREELEASRSSGVSSIVMMLFSSRFISSNKELRSGLLFNTTSIPLSGKRKSIIRARISDCYCSSQRRVLVRVTTYIFFTINYY